MTSADSDLKRETRRSFASGSPHVSSDQSVQE